MVISGAFKTMSQVSIAILCAISANLVMPLCGVLHGIPTAPFEFPELARIYRCNVFRCTATILNRHWIMTSAYCFVDPVHRAFNLTEFFVNVGDHNSSVRESSEQNLSLVEMVVHDNYKRENDYDIVLLRVQPDIKFGATIRPVNLVGCKQAPQPGRKLTLVGYGEYMNFAYRQFAVVPRKGEVEVAPFSECLKSLCGGYECNFAITRFVFCSSSEEGLIGPCAGDPGAPVFIIKEDGAHILAGIATGTNGGGNGHCDNGTYLYTDLAPFVGWIHRRISNCGNYPINWRIEFDKPTTVPCPN